MKKFLAILASLILCIAMLTGCSKNREEVPADLNYVSELNIGLGSDNEEGNVAYFSNETQYKVGDVVKFGKYEQDGDTSNGKEDIEWVVLSVEDGRILVISKYALEGEAYNKEYADVTWETCTLRSWLNDDYYNDAFSDAEKAKIPSVTLENKDNPFCGTAGGNNTTDKVFCLSLDEIEKYFGYIYYDSDYMYGWNQNLICTPTQYAMDNGIHWSYEITSDDYNDAKHGLKKYGYTTDCIGRRACGWWLRSPGYTSSKAFGVNRYGSTGPGHDSQVDDFSQGVRPALYIEY